MSIFVELSVVLAIAFLVSAVVLILRQPLIIGHIITGILVGPYAFNVIQSADTLDLLSHLGIALLLFIIGLGLNPATIKDVGKAATVTGLGQIIFTSVAGYGISIALGYTALESLYISVALTFSSTIIIMKLLGDKRELTTLHGRVATGFLLVQDIVASIALVVITAVMTDDLSRAAVGIVLWLISIGVMLVVVPRYLLPFLGTFIARSPEFLFIFALAWGMGIAAICKALGFSAEIGALAAGIALAGSPYSYDIGAKLRPLRDFFVVIFFILLGSRIELQSLLDAAGPAAIFSIFVLFGNPLIMVILMGVLGYRSETSFKSGLAVAQISEFSLILVLLGQQAGHVSSGIVSMVTLVGLVTIAGSTYMIIGSDTLYLRLKPLLMRFERKGIRRKRETAGTYDVIVVGYERAGKQLVRELARLEIPFVVVDYDPEAIKQLGSRGIPARFGDISNPEFMAELELERVSAVLSSVTKHATSAVLVAEARRANPNAIIAVTSDDPIEAEELYQEGATYVIMPHYLGSTKVVALVEKHGLDRGIFDRERSKHQQYLKLRDEAAG
jgi:Kef-type K+ transport system membrane component KefB